MKTPPRDPHGEDGRVATEPPPTRAGLGAAALWGPPSGTDVPPEASPVELDVTAGPDPEDAEEVGTADDASQLDALRRFADIADEDLRRAERIRGRMQTPKPLGEILVDMGRLSQEQFDDAIARRRAQMTVVELLMEGGHLSPQEHQVYLDEKALSPTPSDREVLVDGGLVSEEHYLRAVGTRLQIPFVEPQIGEVDTDLLDRIPFAYLYKHLLLPVREQDGQVVVVVAFPEDERLIVELESTFECRVQRQCSTSFRILEALRTLERIKGRPADQDAFKIHYRELDKEHEHADSTGEEAIQLVDYLLSRAVQLEASDLHIEPTPNKIRVRVRIDGVLQHLTDIPLDFGSRLTARIKILGRSDVTEKRVHQDGKIHVKVDGREIDIRVSTYVSMFGETIVMRLLDRDRSIVKISELGLQPRVESVLTDEVLRASSGLILLVGPTGSGKTTTLYSFVDHANDPTRKVITCEDPVEYVMDGIVQCSIDERAGRTFAQSLRSIVRQDPDTIVVGEIRDRETASLAIEAALTGHKVFSTFHTEEAVGAFVRLLEMGLEPFLVASTVSAVVAQRLVRRLCPKCRVPTRPKLAELRFLNLSRADVANADVAGPVGCKYCSGTGYKGRLGLHEVVVPNDSFRQAVLDQSSTAELRALARDTTSFLSMQEDGLLKALAGQTSFAEIIEHAPRDTTPRPFLELRKIANSRRSR